MSGELLVTLDDAARRLALCRRSVQQLIYAGELASVKIGRCRRVAVVDIEAYVSGLRENDREAGHLAVVREGGHRHGLAASG